MFQKNTESILKMKKASITKMGEYARLNRMLREEQYKYRKLEEKQDKTDDEMEMLADLYQSIGEIKGALLEMADVDGLDDPYMAFDY